MDMRIWQAQEREHFKICYHLLICLFPHSTMASLNKFQCLLYLEIKYLYWKKHKQVSVVVKFLWSVWCSKFSPFCPHLFVQDRCHLSTQWCKRSWFCLYESAVRHKTFIGSGSTRTEASVVINNGWKETTCKMWAAGNWQRWINNKDSEVCFMDTDNQWCESKWFLINAQIYNMRLLLKLLPTETNQAKKNLL